MKVLSFWKMIHEIRNFLSLDDQIELLHFNEISCVWRGRWVIWNSSRDCVLTQVVKSIHMTSIWQDKVIAVGLRHIFTESC
jgi:hypothetical protein